MQLRIPTHLSTAATAWMDGLRDDREWTPSEWKLLQLAAEAWDRSQTARRLLSREGLVCRYPIYEGKGEFREHVGERVTPHPATAIARDNTTLFSRLTGQLGLDRKAAPEGSADTPIKGQTNILDELAARRNAS